jgi:hypothetical protein
MMQHRDALPLSHRCDQQVRQADRPHLPEPQHGLNLQRPPPVLITGRQPLITTVTISP